MAWTRLKLAAGASLAILLAWQHHQNAVQAQQLVAAREDLRARTEAVAAQESQIAELEQQSTAILETRREQEQDLARLRARRTAQAKGSPAPSAAAPTTLLSATLQDPVEREALRRGLVSGLRFRWEPLVKGLNLAPEDAEKLYRLGGDWLMKNLEAVVAFTEGRLTAEGAVQVAAQAEQEATNQVRLLVGEEGMAKYHECDRSLAARLLIKQFDQQLGFFKVNDEQRARLAEVISAEPYELARGMVGYFEVREVVFPDELRRRFEQTAGVNQRVLQKAAEFLPPEQVEALGHMQAYNLSNQKRLLLRMLRKL